VPGKLGLWKVEDSVMNKLKENKLFAKKIVQWQSSEHCYREECFRALSIKQPFAEAILRGVKTVENRNQPLFKLRAGEKLPKLKKELKQTRFQVSRLL